MTKVGTQYLSGARMWRFLNFASQTKHALEKSFPNMKNASTFRAVFSSHRHSYTSIPPFHLSTWLTENRQAIKNTSTSNHGDNVAHYSLALSQRFWHSGGRKRRGEDRIERGANHNTRRETGTWTSEPLLLNQKTQRPIKWVNQAS